MNTKESQSLPISAAIDTCNKVRPFPDDNSIQNKLRASKFENTCLKLEYYLKQRLHEANLKPSSDFKK